MTAVSVASTWLVIVEPIRTILTTAVALPKSIVNQGSNPFCSRHHFTFLTLLPSSLTTTAAAVSGVVYLLASTVNGLKVFKLTDYNEKDTVCWKFGTTARLGVSPITATATSIITSKRISTVIAKQIMVVPTHASGLV